MGEGLAAHVVSNVYGNGVSYKQVEYVGAGIGARKLRLVF